MSAGAVRALVGLIALSACGRLDFAARAPAGDATADGLDSAAGDAAGDAAMADARASRTAPPAGHVLALPGTGYVSADALCGAMSASAAMTVNAWVLPAATQPIGNPEIAAFNTGDGTVNLSLLQWTGSAFNYYDDGASGYQYSGLTIAPGTWHYASFVVDAAGVGVVYQDGVAQETFTTPRRIPSTGRFSLGQEWDGNTTSDFFAGHVDEVTVWRVARTQAEIVDEMNTGPSIGAADLVAYFPFETGVADASGNGYDGTLQATAAIVTTP